MRREGRLPRGMMKSEMILGRGEVRRNHGHNIENFGIVDMPQTFCIRKVQLEIDWAIHTTSRAEVSLHVLFPTVGAFKGQR